MTQDQLLKARVISGHGRHYIVELDDGQTLLAYPRGKRLQACVGDWVDILPQSHAEQAALVHIHPRRTLLYRSDAQRSKLLAANVDQVLLVISGFPMFSSDLLGRALTAAWAANVHPLVILNKIDEPRGLQEARERLLPYSGLDLDILEVSALDPQQIRDTLGSHLNAKTSLLLGQSAMGKSTLLNSLVPDANATTQAHSMALGAGRHTTTATRLYELPTPLKGALIDSPGLQTFGLAHLKTTELIHGFPEFLQDSKTCRFHNCTHLHEPNCVVRQALDETRIHPERYALYERLFSELELANARI